MLRITSLGLNFGGPRLGSALKLSNSGMPMLMPSLARFLGLAASHAKVSRGMEDFDVRDRSRAPIIKSVVQPDVKQPRRTKALGRRGSDHLSKLQKPQTDLVTRQPAPLPAQ